MEIRRVQGLDDRWDEFVWNSPMGTVFHMLKFLSYHPEGRFDFFHLAVHRGGELVCVIPGGRVESGGRDVYRSPVGASFGGFVFQDLSDNKTLAGVVDAVADYVREAGMAGLELAFPPACYARGAMARMHSILAHHGFVIPGREATSVVPLEVVSEEGLDPDVRRNVRKAAREGVTVAQGTDLKGFYAVLEKNLAAKDATPTHSLAELETLFRLLPGYMTLFEARHEGEVVGGSLVMLCNPVTALTFYICDDPERRHLRVTEASLSACLDWAIESGHEYLDLGTVSVDGRMNQGLLRFKSKFSSKLDYRTYYQRRFDGAEQ